MPDDNSHRDDPTQVKHEPKPDFEFEVETIRKDGDPARPASARPEPFPLGLGARRYRIIEKLGEGGMAVVYQAQDQVLVRNVAVKCLHPTLDGDQDAVIRFFDEARIMGSLSHPGAVSVYDAGKLEDGRWFFAMKRIRGRTLSSLLADRSPVQIRDRSALAHSIDIFQRVCETVGAAHADGVIHRDLKPENIMVDDFGAVYVMDWGLAKRLPKDEPRSDSGRTSLGMVIGTPAYMSPEQARGQAYRSDRQTDVFSLGVILYEILTGIRPFGGDTMRETIKQVVFSEPKHPLQLNKWAGRELAAICLKAMHKDPQLRYRDAGDLAADIARYREFMPVSAIEPRLVDRWAKWSRRRPAIAGAISAVLILLALSLVGLTVQVSLERTRLHNAHAILDAQQKQIDDINAVIADLSGQLLSTAEGSPGRAELERKLHDLRALRQLTADHMVDVSTAIIGYTLIAPDARAQKIVRDDSIHDIDNAMTMQEYAVAKALVDYALKAYEQKNLIGWSHADVSLLKRKAAEIDAAIRLDQQQK